MRQLNFGYGRNVIVIFAATALLLLSVRLANAQSEIEWQELPIYGGTARGIAFDPTSNSTVFAAAGGVFRSNDSGQTWQDISGDLPTRQTRTIAVHPTNNQILYAATRTDLYKSTNGGTHWIVIMEDEEVNTIAIDPRMPSSVYVGTDDPPGDSGAVYRSQDGGTNWQSILTFSNEGVDIEQVLLTANTRNIVVETHYQGYSSLRLSPIDNIGWGSSAVGGGATRQRHLTQVPGNLDVLYAIDSASSTLAIDLYSSTDGGATWQLVRNTPVYWGDTQGLAVSRDQRTVYLLDYNGIYVSSDGGDWSRPDELEVVELGIVASSPHSDSIALASGGYSANIYRTADSGTTWSTSSQGIPAGIGDLTIDPRNRQRLMAASYGGGALLSEDGGATWRQENEGINGLVQAGVNKSRF